MWRKHFSVKCHIWDFDKCQVVVGQADWIIVPKYFLLPSHGETSIIIRHTGVLRWKGTYCNLITFNSSIWKVVVKGLYLFIQKHSQDVAEIFFSKPWRYNSVSIVHLQFGSQNKKAKGVLQSPEEPRQSQKHQIQSLASCKEIKQWTLLQVTEISLSLFLQQAFITKRPQ